MSLSSLLHWFYCLDYQDLFLLISLATVFYLWLVPMILNKQIYQALNQGLFMLWILLIIIITIHGRTTTLSSPNFQPFHSYKEALETGNVEIYRSNLMNFLLFYPLGLFGFGWFKKRPYIILSVTLAALCMSIVIELIQYKFMLGHTEIDDVIHNTLGAFSGITLACVTRNASERNSDEPCH